MPTFEHYYAQIRTDSPEMSELEVRINARQAAHMHAWLEERRKQPRAVRLLHEHGGFVSALFNAVETTGRMPAVKKQKEEPTA